MAAIVIGSLLHDKPRETGFRPPKATGSAFDFGGLAERYDDWYERPVGRVYDILEKRAVSEFLPDATHGDQLLEVGCGTGHWSAFFAEHDFRVTGVDISASMLEIARGKGIRGADFYQGEADAIPFYDNAFDVVVAITLLEFVPQPQTVLEEMARCVRDQGSIIVGVLNRWSYQGLSRRIWDKPLFRSASFFSRKSLKKLLAHYGQTEVRSAAFFLPWTWALAPAPVVDRTASAFGLPFGDFLVGRVQR